MKKISYLPSFFCLGLVGASFALIPQSVQALDLDWSGRFRAEAHHIRNYALDSSPSGSATDAARVAGNGYYVPGGGKQHANFQTLFLELKPKVVVNDNIYIKSEFWLGDPVYGIFGDATPYPASGRQYYSNQSRGSTITAQRFWAEFLSDVGTFQVGRAPLHWGLGLVWNSGDGLWDREKSTGDTMRLVSKFGAFSFVPSFIKYSQGNNVGGACNFAAGTCTVQPGSGSVSELSFALKYENPDEEFETGVNFIRRITGVAQDTATNGAGFNAFGTGTNPGTGVPLQGTAGGSYNTWNLYGKKNIGSFTFAGEIPIVSGKVGGLDYKTYAVALETQWRISNRWEMALKAGHAPGSPSFEGGAPTGEYDYKGFYFHPTYTLGLIMFNYQLRNFAGPNTLNNANANGNNVVSPFDNSVTNASYLAWTGMLKGEKWSFYNTWIYAHADETAEAGKTYFNSWTRTFQPNAVGRKQAADLGIETDIGTTFRWDDTFTFGADLGLFFPGKFYAFSNTARDNTTATVIAGVLKVGVSF